MEVCHLWGGLIYLLAPSQTRVTGVEMVVEQAVVAPYYKSGESVFGVMALVLFEVLDMMKHPFFPFRCDNSE